MISEETGAARKFVYPHAIDWLNAVEAYMAAGYSREGAESALDEHCRIIAAALVRRSLHKAIAVTDIDPAEKTHQQPS